MVKQGTAFRVESYAVETLLQIAVVEKNITDVEAVGDAIKRVCPKSVWASSK